MPINSNKRRRQKGLSYIEILVSIVLLTTVMMTFALVFPSGYKLVLKTRMKNRAAEIANGLVNKINNVPFKNLNSANPSIETLENWPANEYATYTTNEVPTPFIADKTNADPKKRLIYVDRIDPTLDGGTLAKIQVTIYWKEKTPANGIDKTYSVTVTTYRSRNH